MVRLVIPISRPRGFFSEIASKPGEIRQLAVVELGDTGALEEIGFLDTSNIHPEFLSEVFLELEPDAVLANPLDENAVALMLENGVVALAGDCKTLKDVIRAYLSGSLVPIVPWSDYDLERPLN
ncbi:MAG: hypothetical protein DRO05_02880 [Thermoproteota archaeon]|nr:MAG: hypothetical protein DRO05_02880 [Candidatus Korarchaeota archaeon]